MAPILTDAEVLPTLNAVLAAKALQAKSGAKSAPAPAASNAPDAPAPAPAASKRIAKQDVALDDDLRIFGWFATADIPAALMPLVRAYRSWAATLVADPRDIIFVTYMLFYFVTIVPSTIGLLIRFSWIHAIAHTIALAVFTAPFILMLHCLCHRKIASPNHPWLDHVVHVVLSPFFGETWNTFYYHHVKHHHVEDNNPDDLSSTIWYDRDNALHFLIYYLRFFLLIVVELPLYFVRKGKYVWAFNAFFGEIGTLVFYASFFWLCPNNAAGVIAAWFVPFNLARYGMMSGNWAQHAFVEPTDPTNDYKTAITCLQSFYNTNCFNDGYHTSHHLNPLRRWEEHPQHFVDSAEKYREQTVIVFKDIDFHGIWCLLMIKDYKTMARHFVQIGEPKMSEEEVMDFLKARTKRMTPEAIAKHFKKQV
ncbi:fatty acid desaturase-domain-containing protein [Entophlyctis helioformis]|nr:fatty acid desaturase-domain-containing protein [Entophlyctis helioformis]KAI8927934.1 fatty acid desaturase-domain-containing protein [Entophlyctis helioformis]